MKKKSIQFGMVFTGVLVLVIGVVIMTKINLGMAPYDGLIYNASIALNISYGLINISAGVILVLLQVLILRKEFKLVSLVQFIMLIFISFLMDFFMYTVFAFDFSNELSVRIPLFALSTVLIALGISLFMAAGLYSFPLETLMGIVYEKFRIRLVIVKWGFDGAFIALSYFLAKIAGLATTNIGLGTIILFVVTSPIINVFFDFFVKQLKKVKE